MGNNCRVRIMNEMHCTCTQTQPSASPIGRDLGKISLSIHVLHSHYSLHRAFIHLFIYFCARGCQINYILQLNLWRKNKWKMENTDWIVFDNRLVVKYGVSHAIVRYTWCSAWVSRGSDNLLNHYKLPYTLTRSLTHSRSLYFSLILSLSISLPLHMGHSSFIILRRTRNA